LYAIKALYRFIIQEVGHIAIWKEQRKKIFVISRISHHYLYIYL